MSTVIAAVGDDRAAATVIAVAAEVARLFGATVVPVHVREDEVEGTRAANAARTAGLALRVREGDRFEELAREAERGEVAAVALAARGRAGDDRPLATTALRLVTSLTKPVVVVPPGAEPRGIERLFVPLDARPESAEAVGDFVSLTRAAGSQVVLAHVFGEEQLPAFSDQLQHEVRAWADEFRTRAGLDGGGAELQTRVGSPEEGLPELARECDCDLVVLAWAQDLARGRAHIVRAFLRRARVPVALVPRPSDPGRVVP